MFTKKEQTRGNALAFGIIILALLFIFYMIFFGSADQPDSDIDKPEDGQEMNWQTYTNEEYSFEIQYPEGWEVREFPKDLDGLSPKFNIFKKGQEGIDFPLTHHSNQVSHVSIFPEGVPTEGVFGQIKESEISIEGLSIVNAIDYVLENGQVWASYINLESSSENWQQPGFIWASVDTSSFEVLCSRDGEILEDDTNCDPFTGDEIVRRGVVDEELRQTEEKIIKSFRFLEN